MSRAKTGSAQRRWRSMMWSLFAIVALAVALPSVGYLTADAKAQAQGEAVFGDRATNPRSDTWRQVREGEPGFTNQSGPYVTNTLINNSGQNWRQLRMGPLVTFGGGLIALMLVGIALFYLVVGRAKLEKGRAGRTIERWKTYERVMHWYTAILFVLLAITGLSLLFGRAVLIPAFGPNGFAAYAQYAMFAHNVIGPAFAVGVAAMILLWMRHNIPNKTDLEWFKQGGGIIGNKHPSAGKMNAGEKVWFWTGVFGLGLLVIVSGFILDFPNWGFQTRETMAWAHITHATAAVVWIAMFFGHAYIGTIGTEGALEGMTTGRVDVNWARQHHDLWYEELIANGERPLTDQEVAASNAQAEADKKSSRPVES